MLRPTAMRSEGIPEDPGSVDGDTVLGVFSALHAAYAPSAILEVMASFLGVDAEEIRKDGDEEEAERLERVAKLLEETVDKVALIWFGGKGDV